MLSITRAPDLASLAAAGGLALSGALLARTFGRREARPPWPPPGCAVLLGAWVLAAALTMAIPRATPLGAVALTALHAVGVLAVAVALIRAGWVPAARPSGAGRLLGEGFRGGGMCLAGGFFAVWILGSLRGVPVDDKAVPIVEVLAGRGGAFWERALALFLAVGLAPAAEEVVFRGALQGLLRAWMGAALAVLATAFAFAFCHAAHPSFPWNLPPMIWVGCVLGVVRERPGGLAAAVLAHSVNNALALAWAVWM